MNGFELCEIIKYKCPWTIVIAITGYPLKYEFMKVKEVGFDDYIEKPFPIKVIVGIVRRELHRIVAWKTIQGETKTT
jgi:CheY-like chemotaxis protein